MVNGNNVRIMYDSRTSSATIIVVSYLLRISHTTRNKQYDNKSVYVIKSE